MCPLGGRQWCHQSQQPCAGRNPLGQVIWHVLMLQPEQIDKIVNHRTYVAMNIVGIN